VKKHIWVAAVSALIAGCTPEAFRRSADLQVDQILRERKKQTLDYLPQTEARTDVPLTPPRQAFEKIPVSPISPPVTPPMELERVKFMRTPLGPELSLKDVTPVRPGKGIIDVAAEQQKMRTPLGPPALGQQPRRFDLFACLEYAVQHSRNYEDQMELLYEAALDVTLQRHLFEPRPFAQTAINYVGGQRDVDYRSAWTVSNTVGVRQQLPHGGEIVASGLVDFVNTINGNVNDGESASVVLNGSIPLLRGFGMVNLEPLISTERQLVYEVRAFEDFRRSFVVDIASRYFQLLASQQGVFNRRLNLISLSALTEQSEAIYQAGQLAYIEVQRAQQSQLQAQSDLITAEENYQTALDEFKIVLGMPVDEALDVTPVALDVKVPHVSPGDAVETAHRYRLTVRTAADQIEDAQRNVQVAQNGLLPDLRLTGEGRLGNRVDTPAVDLQADTLDYRAGLALDLPIDRVAERNSYRRSLISLQRAQRNFVTVRDRVTADVREALRSIRAAEISVGIQRQGIELANARLNLANLNLTLGRGTTRDVVEAQTSLLQAQDGLNQARSRLQIRVLEFLRDSGTLRVDPKAGAIGLAMDREKLQTNKTTLKQYSIE
jgi:outer membrane protein TolC